MTGCQADWLAVSCLVSWAVVLLTIGPWITEWALDFNRASGGLAASFAKVTPVWSAYVIGVAVLGGAVQTVLHRSPNCAPLQVTAWTIALFACGVTLIGIAATLLVTRKRRIDRDFGGSGGGLSQQHARRSARRRVAPTPVVLLVAGSAIFTLLGYIA